MSLWRRLFPRPSAGEIAAPPPPPPVDAAAILSGLEEGVLVLDADRRVKTANGALAPYLNRPPAQTPGAYLWEILRHRDVTELVDAVQKGGRPAPREIAFPTPEERIARVTAHPLGQGSTLLTFLDLTHTRRLETLRREFVANVSHELKTPLTALRAAIETLLDGALSDPAHARDFLDTALHQVQRLQRLIDDVLTLSRMERTEEPARSAHCDAVVVARRALDTFSALAAQRGISLHSELPATLPLALSEDELSQALINLIDNAVKFTPAGGRVSLSARRTGDVGIVSVEDSGAGIPPEDLPRVFERFFRGDRARTAQTGGTGLGLAIVKHTVERRGGAVRVESHLGRGSRFELRLPAVDDR
jgi:two-component system phosphate regulon sensor histidine kinase PhoR